MTRPARRPRRGQPGDFVFAAEKGGVLHLRNFRRMSFDPAVRAAGLDGLAPHALRHTAASLAIASGANVTVVQTMLGHQSATMTLDLYGHLLNDQLDEVADAMARRVPPRPRRVARQRPWRRCPDGCGRRTRRPQL